MELILALSLSVVLLMAVGMAVNLHLRSFDARQNMLQESQLARAVLQIIAKDIRSVVVHYEQDVSGVEAMLANATSGAGGDAAAAGGNAAGAAGGDAGAAAGGDAAGGGTAGGGGAAAGGDAAGGGGDAGAAAGGVDDMGASATTTDLSTTATLPTTPGIYGNQFQLQIDISRLPRQDEYQQAMLANPTAEMVDIPSDVKTVSYFMQTDGDQATASSLDPIAAWDGTQSGGLVRRQLDRAVTQWATLNASATSLMQTGDLLAPEVVGIEFQYFDGVEWLMEWDTEYQEALPMAIQIVLMVTTMDPNQAETADVLEVESATRYYRLVVNVPGGEVATDTTTTDTGAGTTADTAL